jgi:hypothetical protein
MTTAFRITYLKNGQPVGTTIIDSLEGEVADKALNAFTISVNKADDFTITEGTFVPSRKVRGAVVFTAK